MRPLNRTARDRLPTVLSHRAAVSAAELAGQLDISVPTLHRLLKEQGSAVVSVGRARRSRYALRRPLRGDHGDMPLYAVDATGRAERVAQLAFVHPYGSCIDLAGAGWPVPDTARDGWWDGLPYPLYDMRPQGYLGRQLARAAHSDLGVSVNPADWSDDDIAYVLSRAGSDMSGNLILGDPAFERWQARKLAPPEVLMARALGRGYLRLAEQAVAEGVPGSSAAGEFPKFPALREQVSGRTPHVLVKFSGADASRAVQRWSDLLVCEHLALECAASLPGLVSASSRVLGHGGRTFLEVERFDRHGLFGRGALVSLATLDAALLGAGVADWTLLADRLVAIGVLAEDVAPRIRHLWWFGRLIANSDMHAGNVSFGLGEQPGTLTLAPTYDMLPMLYAPLPGGEVPRRSFETPLPLPPQRAVWLAACGAAVCFWARAGSDKRIGEAFRRTCLANAQQLEQVAARV